MGVRLNTASQIVALTTPTERSYFTLWHCSYAGALFIAWALFPLTQTSFINITDTALWCQGTAMGISTLSHPRCAVADVTEAAGHKWFKIRKNGVCIGGCGRGCEEWGIMANIISPSKLQQSLRSKCADLSARGMTRLILLYTLSEQVSIAWQNTWDGKEEKLQSSPVRIGLDSHTRVRASSWGRCHVSHVDVISAEFCTLYQHYHAWSNSQVSPPSLLN